MAAAIPAAGVIDSDILIDGMHSVPLALTFLSALPSAAARLVSQVSAMELVSGCRNAQELAALQRFLVTYTLLPVSEPTSHRAYQLLQAFFSATAWKSQTPSLRPRPWNRA